MSDNFDEQSAVIAERFKNEMSKNKFAAKTTSREIGAHENTLGNYIRGKVPDQWVYLAKLHEKGIDIRYQHYSIGPYAYGMPVLSIPYNKLGGIIKPRFIAK